MRSLAIDFESRSTVDLRAAGLHNYATSPDTEIWCMAFAFGDDEPQIWLPSQPSTDAPYNEIRKHIQAGGEVRAFNAAFELALWANIMVPRHGWPPLKPEQCRCTMAMAYAMALPGSLEKAAAAVGISEQKDLVGGRLMLQMARPRSYLPPAEKGDDGVPVPTWWDDPDKLAKLYEYCRQDVRVERELEKRLMALSGSEQRLWTLDHTINQRGVFIDTKAVTAAIAVVQAEQDRLNKEMRRVTGNFVGFCTEVARIGKWAATQGAVLPGVAKADVLEALDRSDLPDNVRQALLLRQEAGKSSTAKLTAMLSRASTDGRLRGMLQYHGASTGRWAGRGVQLHNLPRPKIKQDEIERAIDLLAGPGTPESKAATLDMLYGSPLDVISSCLRGMLTASPGHALMAADFSAIEARVLAWLAGEEAVLNVFRGHGRIYEHAAANIYRKRMEDVTKDERQVGKVAVLALGYGGGKGAFQVMAKGYGVKVGDDAAEEIKLAWRAAHPNIVQYWYDVERAAMSAVLNPGSVQTAGPKGRAVKFRVNGSFLWCLLPSGRALTYPYPKIKARETPWGEMKDGLHFMTVDGLSNKWLEASTYGGSLVENITQAVARDLLAEAIVRCEAAKFPVVLHVHDEVVAELPSDLCHTSQLRQFEELCAETPAWAAGLPVTAEGWRGKRYRK